MKHMCSNEDNNCNMLLMHDVTVQSVMLELGQGQWVSEWVSDSLWLWGCWDVWCSLSHPWSSTLRSWCWWGVLSSRPLVLWSLVWKRWGEDKRRTSQTNLICTSFRLMGKILGLFTVCTACCRLLQTIHYSKAFNSKETQNGSKTEKQYSKIH